MVGRGIILGLSLLLFVGCLSTRRAVAPFDDPFPVVVSATQSPAPLMQPLVPTLQLSAPVEDEPLTDETVEDEPVKGESLEDEASEDEYEFEPEDTTPMTEAEQAALLSQNQWIKNVHLINMIESGRKTNKPAISSAERQRREEINLLNMSPQEQAKRQNLRYEYIDGTVSDWRWMHRGVDQLYAMPPSQRVSPDTFLRSKQYKDKKYAVLRANAAILMGRDGNVTPAVKKYLTQIAESETTDYKIRCAAVEVLGRMETITADELIPLLEDVKLTEVWEEILTALAEKIDPWEHDCFLEPFFSPISSVRLTAAKIWRKKSAQYKSDALAKRELPDRFLDIAKKESNAEVRVEIIKTLGMWQVPGLFTMLENDLRNRSADVRNAAMIALADARCEEAIPIIKEQVSGTIATNRAAATSALRKLGALDEVFKLVNDQDPMVRVEVAKAFSERCTSQTATFAKSYISDRNAKVQSATIEAVGGWSVEEAGPLILSAAKSPFPEVRCLAVEMLAQRGVAYSGFDPEAKPATQTAQYQELVETFRETVGVDPILLEVNGKDRNASSVQQVSASVPEDAKLSEVRKCLDEWSDRTANQKQRELIQHRLTAQGQRLMPIIDHLMTVEKRKIPESLDRVFAEVEPMFGEIEKLKSNDISTIRRAAIELSQLGAVGSPPKIVAKRIIDLTAKQDDPQVLMSLLKSLKNADPELVCQLARPLLQSDSARVRILACEMLKQFGTSEDVERLHNSLSDSSREVVRGALSAIDFLWEEDDADASSVVETLKKMLLKGDAGMQVDIAATLHRHGHSEGTDALRRLASSSDHNVRTYVAKMIPAMDDPAFIPILIRFLDDNNGTVSSWALKGLPILTGKDIGGNGSTQQQIDRWKAWAKK
jgi:HEAT repeat protein